MFWKDFDKDGRGSVQLGQVARGCGKLLSQSADTLCNSLAQMFDHTALAFLDI